MTRVIVCNDAVSNAFNTVTDNIHGSCGEKPRYQKRQQAGPGCVRVLLYQNECGNFRSKGKREKNRNQDRVHLPVGIVVCRVAESKQKCAEECKRNADRTGGDVDTCAFFDGFISH